MEPSIIYVYHHYFSPLCSCSISDIQIALNNVITINERLFPARENWNVTGTSGLVGSSALMKLLYYVYMISIYI